MVSSPMGEGLVYDIKLSSVGPANVTGSDLSVEPSNLDLAMKLHYLRAVYYFESQAFEGLTYLKIKEPMFTWLNKYPFTCGRFRRAESGRPYIKCNDCGMRFVEGKCGKTLEEWLEMKDDIANLEKALVPTQIIGPELPFSPLTFIQFTKFKCGGMAVGLSWAHVLGDAFSVEEFMNMLGRVMSGYEPGQPILNLSPTEIKSTDFSSLQKAAEDPISLKRVGPVGDNWINVTKSNMEAFSFDVNPNKLVDLQSKLGPKGAGCATFQALSAVIWHAIAKIRGNELEPKVVTICKRSDQNKTNEGLGNKQIVSVVKADFAVGEANPSELAALMKNTAFDERKKIEEAMEKENGLLDCIVYGANLTFVNLEDEKLYDFKYGGQKPVRVSYKFDGVGDEGAVLVLPGLNDGSKNVGGRTVMMILPENEIAELKSELKIEGLVE